jgi:hypothetical protein
MRSVIESSQPKEFYYDLVDYYLRHPNKRNFPVVGLSLEQVRLYTIWRSDRVFEMYLINAGYLVPDPKSDFSLQKLMDGQVKFRREPPEELYYPKYRLSVVNDYNTAIKQQREVGSDFRCIDGSDTIRIYRRDEDRESKSAKNKSLKEVLFPMIQTHYGELTADGDTISRKWFDEGLDRIDSANLNTPDAVLCGFRNACGRCCIIYKPV